MTNDSIMNTLPTSKQQRVSWVQDVLCPSVTPAFRDTILNSYNGVLDVAGTLSGVNQDYAIGIVTAYMIGGIKPFLDASPTLRNYATEQGFLHKEGHIIMTALKCRERTFKKRQGLYSWRGTKSMPKLRAELGGVMNVKYTNRVAYQPQPEVIEPPVVESKTQPAKRTRKPAKNRKAG